MRKVIVLVRRASEPRQQHERWTGATPVQHLQLHVLIDGDNVVVMLDWETAHLGDPLEDIGWVTNPLRAREHQIPGVWERAQLCRYYESITGSIVMINRKGAKKEMTLTNAWFEWTRCWKYFSSATLARGEAPRVSEGASRVARITVVM